MLFNCLKGGQSDDWIPNIQSELKSSLDEVKKLVNSSHITEITADIYKQERDKILEELNKPVKKPEKKQPKPKIKKPKKKKKGKKKKLKKEKPKSSKLNLAAFLDPFNADPEKP